MLIELAMLSNHPILRHSLPFAIHVSQDQGIFQGVSFSLQVAKVLVSFNIMDSFKVLIHLIYERMMSFHFYVSFTFLSQMLYNFQCTSLWLRLFACISFIFYAIVMFLFS